MRIQDLIRKSILEMEFWDSMSPIHLELLRYGSINISIHGDVLVKLFDEYGGLDECTHDVLNAIHDLRTVGLMRFDGEDFLEPVLSDIGHAILSAMTIKTPEFDFEDFLLDEDKWKNFNKLNSTRF